MKDTFRICFMGGNTVAVIGLLTVLLNLNNYVLSIVSYSNDFSQFIAYFNVPTYKSIYEKGFVDNLKKSDLLLSVHGREIVNSELLTIPKYGCINVHPYLYAYKGADPIGRAITNNNFRGSVGVHYMTTHVDEGDVIVEEFVNLVPSDDRENLYRQLYPYYSIAIKKTLGKLWL